MRATTPRPARTPIAHLEELRDAGAEFLAFPATALWWMDYYTGLARHLEDRYETRMRTETWVVFDLRDGRAAERPAAASSEVTTEKKETGMAPAAYSDLIRRLRDTIETELPAESTVLVVSRGDDDLLDLNGRQAWHFPRDDEGLYLGYHPGGDDDAIAHLEELRAKGGEYLVFPSAAFWWLDHYAGFAAHLQSRYATVAYEPDVCIVFELTERFLSEVVQALVPDEAQRGRRQPLCRRHRRPRQAVREAARPARCRTGMIAEAGGPARAGRRVRCDPPHGLRMAGAASRRDALP